MSTEKIRLSYTDIALLKYNGDIARQSGSGTLTYSFPITQNIFYVINKIVGYATPALTGTITITVDTSNVTFSNVVDGVVDWNFPQPIVLDGSKVNVVTLAPSSAATTNNMLNIFYSKMIYKRHIT